MRRLLLAVVFAAFPISLGHNTNKAEPEAPARQPPPIRILTPRVIHIEPRIDAHIEPPPTRLNDGRPTFGVDHPFTQDMIVR
jgi:hypothetical protein